MRYYNIPVTMDFIKKKKKQKLASVSENVEKKGGPMYFG